jgi:hypothetical protein
VAYVTTGRVVLNGVVAYGPGKEISEDVVKKHDLAKRGLVKRTSKEHLAETINEIVADDNEAATSQQQGEAYMVRTRKNKPDGSESLSE